MEDRELIDRVIRGDPQAGGEFVRRYLRFVWKILLDCGVRDPEDACQTVFLRLWEEDFRRLRQWRGEGGFHRYLAPIVRHLATDFHRRNPDQATLPLDPWLEGLTDPAGGPENETINLERRRAIEAAVGGLGADDRDLFQRVYLRGQTPVEIAREVGIQRNAVDQRIFQMKKRLREALRGILPELV